MIMINHGTEAFVVKSGERIAQMIVARFTRVEWQDAEELETTLRGEGGFGHTGE